MTELDVVVPLAPGFEEVEAVAIVDVLRRAGLRTVFAGLAAGPVTGSHGIAVVPDATLDDVLSSAARAVVLPGGMPGAAHLRDDPRVGALLARVHAAGGVVAAVCAAPIALGKAGLLRGRRATCYPGFEGELTGATIVADRTATDGRVVTGRGPGAALEFALAVVALLKDEATARKLAEQMFVRA